MPALLVGGGIKRWCCLSDVWHLSVAYIGPKWKTARPWNTKMCTQIADVTRNAHTNFKVKRLKAKVPWPVAYCGGLHSTASFTTDVRHCLSYYAPPLIGGGIKRCGVYRGGRPPTAFSRSYLLFAAAARFRCRSVLAISWWPPAYSLLYRRPLGALSDDAVWCLSVCLLRTSGLSREHRGLWRLKMAPR